jgi:hypothetical protein
MTAALSYLIAIYHAVSTAALFVVVVVVVAVSVAVLSLTRQSVSHVE